MSRYGSIPGIGTARTVFVQSAAPADLESRVNAALVKLETDNPGDVVASILLAGGGNGHTFVVEITVTPPGALVPTFDPIQGPNTLPVVLAAVRCYMAADRHELDVQRTRALAALPAPSDIYDEMVAGASKGTRFMGLIVYTIR